MKIARFLKSDFLFFLMAFLVILLGCLLHSVDFFRDADILPVGDFAANDILIYRAKDFSLFHGNYSRIGFFHPGPFFLQGMALVEILFYDWIPFLKNYYSAQVLFALFLFALSFSVLGYTISRIVQSRLAGCLGSMLLLVFVLVNKACINTSVPVHVLWMLFPWPPFLYLFTAVLLVCSLVNTFFVSRRWVNVALVAAVALVHGHASFIGLVPVYLVVFLASYILMQGAFPGRETTGTSFFGNMHLAVEEIWSIIRANAVWLAGLSIVLLAPVAIHYIQYPDDILKVFTYSASSHKTGSLFDAVLFFVDYIQPWCLVLGLVSLVVLLRLDLPQKLKLLCLALAIANFVTCLFYIRCGVDGLIPLYHYTIYWTFPLWNLHTLIVLSYLFKQCGMRYPLPCGLLFVALLGVFFANLEIERNAARPDPEALAKLGPFLQNRTPGLVCTYDDNSNWPLRTSFYSYMQRYFPQITLSEFPGSVLVPHDMRRSEKSLDTDELYFSTSEHSPESFRFLDVWITPKTPGDHVVKLGGNIHYRFHCEAQGLLESTSPDLGNDFTWLIDRSKVVFASNAPDTPVTVRVFFQIYSPSTTDNCFIEFGCNDNTYKFLLKDLQGLPYLDMPMNLRRLNRISFRSYNAVSPLQAGQSEDPRKLSIGVHAISFIPFTENKD